MGRQPKTLEIMEKRVNELKERFDEFVEYFDKSFIFSGPSLYFHRKTIEELRKNSLSGIFTSERFFEYLYATLASWGLHRMGNTNTKLVDFDDFKKSIIAQKEKFLALENMRITKLINDNSHSIIIQLQGLIENLKIGKGSIKIVFNSKAIHHLLPDLMPPIDRQYTLLFFYNSTNPTHIDKYFSEIYPQFISIATYRKNTVYKQIGKGFHTSETKVIDNAIVGYVLKKGLKSQKRNYSV